MRQEVWGSHPGLLAGSVSFGITKNEPHVFAELNGRLVLPLCQITKNGAKVHGGVHDLQVVLMKRKERHPAIRRL